RLSLPVGCKIGTVCSIQNHVDRDPGPGARDYTCGRLVYNGHKGTDIRLPDASWLDRDIPVLAAAPGEVAGTRNNVRDHAPGKYEPDRNKDRECGNGVLIDHGGGWRTQYCHMRMGSIRVRKGDHVKRQQPLGIIGLSGKTEFPHLHLSVRYRGKVVDPFLGAGAKPGCGVKGKPLWEPDLLPDLAYRPSGVLASGFTEKIPTLNQIVAGGHRNDHLGRKAPNLVFWVMIFGRQPGDVETLRVIAPDGTVLVQKQGQPAKRHKARWFTYTGKRARRPWAAGTYKGEYQLSRTAGNGRQVVLKTTATVGLE
ncbi:MAG: M23 family metallopeptidase, partial [Rhodospirillaceae bacterium]|nr:M23 family metallopeptidase [Rhodospirillaceae bacterium]